MTSLFLGHLRETGVPADEKVVRNTATPVDPDAPAAMQTDMPEMGEVETDPNPNLGMTTRQMASKWIQGRRGVSREVISEVDGGTAHNAIINEQVSDSGLAASQEAAGQSNPNLSYAVGIEPVGDLRDGGKMGNEYFVRHPRDIQSTMTDSMSVPAGLGSVTSIQVTATGKKNAREASVNPYQAFWNEGK